MDKEKYVYQKTEINRNKGNNKNNSKVSPSQKNDLELKRFNSQEVYLVKKKKPENDINLKKNNKKIYIDISKDNQDKIKPKLKKSFNINSIKKQNMVKSTKILNEESILEIDSEGENDDNYKKMKKIKENNIYEKKNGINSQNRIIKKIDFDEIQNNNNELINQNRELLLISKKGDKEKLLELLGQSKININFQNENGWSALHFASDEGNLKIVDILIKSNINLDLKTNDEKKTALHLSVNRGYFDISKLLIENGAKINIRDREQNLPIHICAAQGHDEILNYILEKNSSGLKLKNVYNKSPIDLATKESTKEIIKKYLDLKKIKIEKQFPNNDNNNFSRIKIRKTNKNIIKYLMIPIAQNELNNDSNNIFKRTKSKKLNTNKTYLSMNNNKDINTNSTLTNSVTKNYNTNPSVISGRGKKERINTSSKKLLTTSDNELKNNINKKNKLKINISSSNKQSNNNNEMKNSITDKNKNYLNTTSNKNKTIYNIHISCNNTGNKSPSPNREEQTIHYNTSSNMNSSGKKIINKTNNNLGGKEIFLAQKKEKIKGKIINIPKKSKTIKDERSKSKKIKISSVWKTVTQTDRIAPKFSPNIKYMEKYKKKNVLFKKDESKIVNNNTGAKRTVSVPRFLDTEYILEPQNKKLQFKKEGSVRNKFKVPKKNKINKDNNQIQKNKNNKKINKNVKYSQKNTKIDNLGNKNSLIYTEEGAHLIDDLDEEEVIIEDPKSTEKNKNIPKILKKNQSKENTQTSKIKAINNSINIAINIPQNNQNNNNMIKKSLNINQNFATENDEDDDIEELDDSFYTSDSEESDSNKNEKIGPSDFVCLALLGQGSFGEVYLVKKKDSDDLYAMKVLDKCRIAKQNIFKYVLTERNVLSVMHNPFIVRLNYAFQTSEKLFLLLDYCPGGDLSKQLQIQTRFSEEKAKFYICEIILALGELHKHNIIFRDLKPDNVVIDREGHALLTDFGLSREGIVGKDMAKSFCGSIAYLAPEMINRSGHGKAVDWYLLGVLFYELLVGVPPYFTNNQEQIFRNIQNAQLYIPPFISEKAENLIKNLLKKNPNERLGSKRDVEEIKENEYFSDVDWQKVYERKYKPPQVYLKSNHLQFFRQPVQFRENEEDDLFVKDNSINDYNKYNQDILNSVNNYEGWSFVQKKDKENNNINENNN